MVAAGVLLGDPKFEQIQCGAARAVNSQAVRGQTQARQVRVKIARRKILVLNLLEKHADVHD